jgi:hypothetical protein
VEVLVDQHGVRRPATDQRVIRCRGGRPNRHLRRVGIGEVKGRRFVAGHPDRQDLQDRDDELAAARAANRDLITTLNGRTR